MTGGVIGWVRYQKIIPYDEDLDLTVDKKDWRSARFLKFMEEISTKYGFHIYYRSNLQSMDIDYSKSNKMGLGLWSMWLTKTRMIYVPHGDD